MSWLRSLDSSTTFARPSWLPLASNIRTEPKSLSFFFCFCLPSYISVNGACPEGKKKLYLWLHYRSLVCTRPAAAILLKRKCIVEHTAANEQLTYLLLLSYGPKIGSGLGMRKIYALKNKIPEGRSCNREITAFRFV